MAIRPAYALPSVDQRDTPEVQPVSGSVTVDGTVTAEVEFPASLNVGNFPSVQPVSGTVTVANPSPATDVSGLLTNTQLRAAAVTVASDPLTHRYGGGKTAVVATVTAAGDTTIRTPAAGKSIRLYWVSAINDPDQATTPLIKISLGATEVYRTFAVAHWEMFTGAVNAALVVNLDGAASVAVTAHIEEV